MLESHSGVELDPSLLFPEDMPVQVEKEICVDAQTLALYFYEKKLSVRQARQKYGIVRRVHEPHISFAHEFQTELLSLQAGGRPNSPYYLSLTAEETL